MFEFSHESTPELVSARAAGDLTIYHAAEFAQRLLEVVALGADVELNVVGATDCDSSAIQILLVAKREAGRLDRRLRVTGHSRPVLDTIETLDASRLLGDPVVIAAG